MSCHSSFPSTFLPLTKVSTHIDYQFCTARPQKLLIIQIEYLKCTTTAKLMLSVRVKNAQLFTRVPMIRFKMDGKKRSRTLQMLYYWGKFVGVAPSTLSDNNEIAFSHFGLIYGCLLFATYSYVLYHVLCERIYLLLPGETPIAVIVDVIGILGGYIEISLTWLIFGFGQNRIKLVIQSFANAEKVSRKLDVNEDYEKHFEKLGISAIIVHMLYIFWKVYNNAAMGFYSDAHMFLWTCYTGPRIISFTVWTLFIWSLVIVKEKFHRLNSKLRIFMSNEVTPRLSRNWSCNAIFLSEKIDIISELHRALRDVINRIEALFALVILLNILTQFANITLNLHVSYRFLKSRSGIKETSDVVYLGVIVCWIVIPVAVLAVISSVCSSTVAEANETGNILHAMLINCNSLQTHFQQFQLLSLNLLQRPVKMSLYGFIDLNSFMVYSTVATATTYLTIMLQFYG